MIIRARPKYFKPLSAPAPVSANKDDLYFTSGRAAFKFLLQCLTAVKGKALTVGIQSFNCRVVADAALEAGCTVYLLDINVESFSVPLSEVQKTKKPLDVLLLTHYQGIPNDNYADIANYCKSNGTILIEDLAHGDTSTINGLTIGTLGNYNIYSYAFDKPYTCLHGGKLSIVEASSEQKNELALHYKNLPIETDKDAKTELEVLNFVYKKTEEPLYKKGLDDYEAILNMTRLLGTKTAFALSALLTFPAFRKPVIVLLNLLKQNDNTALVRLNPAKIGQINAQQELFMQSERKTEKTQHFIYNTLGQAFELNGARIEWNRYSLIDETGKLKERLLNSKIECGNFNWPVPLHRIYLNNAKVIKNSDFKTSTYVSEHILNIPVWQIH